MPGNAIQNDIYLLQNWSPHKTIFFLTEKNHNADGYFIRTIDKMSKFDKVEISGIHDFSKTNWNKVWSGIIKAMISADIF